MTWDKPKSRLYRIAWVNAWRFFEGIPLDLFKNNRLLVYLTPVYFSIYWMYNSMRTTLALLVQPRPSLSRSKF